MLLDASTNTTHTWYSEFSGGCGIASWTTNSRVAHAVSRDGVHFAKQDGVFPVWTHEPGVVRAPNGSIAIYFTADLRADAAPRPPCRDCAGGATRANSDADTNLAVIILDDGSVVGMARFSQTHPFSYPHRFISFCFLLARALAVFRLSCSFSLDLVGWEKAWGKREAPRSSETHTKTLSSGRNV